MEEEKIHVTGNDKKKNDEYHRSVLQRTPSLMQSPTEREESETGN